MRREDTSKTLREMGERSAKNAKPFVEPDLLRFGICEIKDRWHLYCKPAFPLPADYVLEEVVRRIVLKARDEL